MKNNPRVEVRNILRDSPILRKTPWETRHVKDGPKGPMVWRAKRGMIWLADPQGLPVGPYHLLVAQNVLNPHGVNYFVGHAPRPTAIETLLQVALSRWGIERVFEDAKGELGMDHFEVRKFRSIERHLLLSCVSHRFLAECCFRHGGGDPGLTICRVRTAPASLAARWAQDGRCSRRRAESIAAQLTLTPQRNAKAARSHRKRTIQRLHAMRVKLNHTQMPLATLVALSY